jgi:hypothetical protein
MFSSSQTRTINRATPIAVQSTASEPKPKTEQDRFTQFAKIDEGFWAWHFTLRGAHGEELASISRAFRGFGREIFTDTGKLSIFHEGKKLAI